MVLGALVALLGCGPGASELVVSESDGQATGERLAVGAELMEWDFFDRLNAVRASRGARPLVMSTGFRQVAREWAVHLADLGRLEHRGDLGAQGSRVSTAWLKLGENVGTGGTVLAIHNAFVASPHHFANMVDPLFNYVGIGVEVRGSTIWVAVNFAQVPAWLTIAAPPPTNPFGSLDVAVRVPGGIHVAGWAMDPETSESIPVHVYVGSVGTALTANLGRADVGAAYPGMGSAHGFDAVLGAPPGLQNVCAYAINVGRGTNTLIACRQIAVQSNPFGSLDIVARRPGGEDVAGWVIDPDTTASIDVHVYVDGRIALGVRADASRGDVANAYPGYGAAHGFSFRLDLEAGHHTVCVFGINAVQGDTNPLIGCRDVDVATAPIGNLEIVDRGWGFLRLRGWALDPDTTDSIAVHAYVDGRFAGAAAATGERPDIGAFFGFWGSAHGFDFIVPAAGGTRTVCVYGINVGKGNVNPALTCRNF